MNKIGNVILKIFGVGIFICLIAGGLSALGYLVALFIGGEIATSLALFIFEKYLPWVIRLTSIFVGLGLIGMYLTKKRSLTINQ